MIDFDVILDMNWLSSYRSILDCYVTTMTLVMPRVYSGSYVIHVQRLVDRGCLFYLGFIQETSVESPPMESILMIQEFVDIFLIDLSSIPPNKNINFSINL